MEDKRLKTPEELKKDLEDFAKQFSQDSNTSCDQGDFNLVPPFEDMIQDLHKRLHKVCVNIQNENNNKIDLLQRIIKAGVLTEEHKKEFEKIEIRIRKLRLEQDFILEMIDKEKHTLY